MANKLRRREATENVCNILGRHFRARNRVLQTLREATSTLKTLRIFRIHIKE